MRSSSQVKVFLVLQRGVSSILRSLSQVYSKTLSSVHLSPERSRLVSKVGFSVSTKQSVRSHCARLFQYLLRSLDGNACVDLRSRTAPSSDIATFLCLSGIDGFEL